MNLPMNLHCPNDTPHTSIRIHSNEEADCSIIPSHQPLALGQKPQRQRWLEHVDQNLSDSSLTFVLYLTAFATGVLDATTYADFRTFASNQTGNTLLLTLAIVGTIPVEIGLTGASLGSYILFSFITGHIGHHFGERRRSWLLISCILQLFLLIISIILTRIWGIQNEQVIAEKGWIIMFFLAASSGVQVAMARTVGIAEIPTAMLSSPLVDFFTDRHLFHPLSHPSVKPRNRRAIYIISIISGSFVGGFAYRYSGMECAIYLAVGVKCCVVVCVGFGKCVKG